jgi:hypothetical protein
VSVPRLAYRPSLPVTAQATIAPSESALGQYPGWLTGPQYPMLALSAARPLGPTLQRTTKSVPLENLKSELVRSRFVLTSESLLTIPTWAERNSANISRVAARY